MCGLFGLAGLVVAPSARAFEAAIVVMMVGLPLLKRHRYVRDRRAVGVLADLVVAAVPGIAQFALGPQSPTGWALAASASIITVTPYFEWPEDRGIALLVVSTAALAYVGGRLLAPAGLTWRQEVPEVIRLGVQTLLAWGSLALTQRAADHTDRLAVEAASRRARAAAAAARRETDRAYLAMLHDTVNVTLLMVSAIDRPIAGAGDRFAWLPEQAQRDLQLLSRGMPELTGHVDLAELLTQLTDYLGMTVSTQLQRPLVVPAGPAMAIYNGVEEGLRNVRRHTGDRDPVLAAHLRGRQIVVMLRDRGPGFDPAAIPRHKRGLSESIVARIEVKGGAAEVSSVSGEGTTVSWRWPV